MRSPAARFILGAVALLALGAAAFFVNQIRTTGRGGAGADRAFDLSAREAANGARRPARVPARLRGGRHRTSSPGCRRSRRRPPTSRRRSRSCGRRPRATRPGSELGEAGDLMTEFASVDQRARDYLKSGQQLMASDVIFTEGDQGAADAAQQLNVARTAEHQAVEAVEAGLRRQQATALGAGAAVAVLVVALLVLLAPRGASPARASKPGRSASRTRRPHSVAVFPDAGAGATSRMARRHRPTSRRARQGRCSGPRRSSARTSAASATSTS